jgi:hypothetical protein
MYNMKLCRFNRGLTLLGPALRAAAGDVILQGSLIAPVMSHVTESC